MVAPSTQRGHPRRRRVVGARDEGGGGGRRATVACAGVGVAVAAAGGGVCDADMGVRGSASTEGFEWIMTLAGEARRCIRRDVVILDVEQVSNRG